MELARTTMALQCATTATMDITHTRALRTATMVLTGSPAASLSALARGSAAIMAVAAITVGAGTVVVGQPMEDAVASLEAAQLDADRLGVASEVVLHRGASQEVAAEAALAEAAALAVADAGKFNIPAGSTLHLRRLALK